MSGYGVTDPPGSGGAGGPATIIDGVNGAIVATVKDYANANPLTVITVDVNGDPVSSGGTTQYAEDSAAVSGEMLAMAGVVRKDVRGTFVDADGDRTELQVTASGDLRVDGSAVTQPVSAASLPLPTGASTEATLALVKAKTDNLDVLLSTRLKSADTLTAITTLGTITNVVHVDDNAGSLTVDGSVTVPGVATAANQATEIASLVNLDVALSTRLKPADTLTAVTTVSTVSTITNVVHVDDNAGSLTVDGPLTDAQLRAVPVPVSGTVAVTGVATAANQATEIASLTSIDTKLTSPLTVTGPLTDTQLRASAVPVSLASVPLPTGAVSEAGGNLATLVALLLRTEELVHLTRRHLAISTALYTHLVSLSSTGISADEVLSVELTSH